MNDTNPPRQTGDTERKRQSLLADAAQRINEELFRRPKEVMQLDPNAIARLEEVHADYLADIGQAAVRLARKSGVRTVDESHVLKAIAISGRSATTLWLAVGTAANTLGGLAGGIACSSVYSIMFQPGPHGPGETIVAVAVSVIAAILLTYGIIITILKRG